MKRAGAAILKIAVSAAILYALFSRMDAAVFWKTVSSVTPASIALAAVIFFCVQCISVLRWSIVLKADAEMPLGSLFSIYFVGMFFNNFLPTVVGGDVVKSYYLYRKTGRGGLAVASILMDRYSGFAALMLITLVALASGRAVVYAVGGGALVSVFAAVIGAFALISAFMWFEALHSWLVRLLGRVHLLGLNRKIDTFYTALMGYRERKGVLARIFFLSLLVQGGGILTYIVLGRGLGMEAPVGHYFLFVPLGVTAAMIPLSLAGLGIREGVLVFLFAGAGASEEQALGMGLLCFFVVVCVSMIGAVEYIRTGGSRQGGSAAIREDYRD